MKNAIRLFGLALALALALALSLPALAQWQTPTHSVPVGSGAGTGFKFAAPGTSGFPLVSQGASSDPAFSATTAITGVGALTQGTWNASTVGVPYGGTGKTTFSANLPVIGNSVSALTQGTVSGNTTQFVTGSGTKTNGHYVAWDSSGNAVDGGTACCASGAVGPGTAGQTAVYAATGSAATGASTVPSGTSYPTEIRPVDLTSTSNHTLSGNQTVDGVSISTLACWNGGTGSTCRIFLRAQTTASQNGCYVPATSAWTRCADMATTGQVQQGTRIFTNGGNTNANTSFVITTANPITIGTTSISVSPIVVASIAGKAGPFTLAAQSIGTTDYGGLVKNYGNANVITPPLVFRNVLRGSGMFNWDNLAYQTSYYGSVRGVYAFCPTTGCWASEGTYVVPVGAPMAIYQSGLGPQQWPIAGTPNTIKLYTQGSHLNNLTGATINGGTGWVSGDVGCTMRLYGGAGLNQAYALVTVTAVSAGAVTGVDITQPGFFSTTQTTLTHAAQQNSIATCANHTFSISGLTASNYDTTTPTDVMLVYTAEAVDAAKLGGSFSSSASGPISTVNATFTVPIWSASTTDIQATLDAFVPCNVGSNAGCRGESFMNALADVWTNEQFDGYLNPNPSAVAVGSGGSGYGASVSGTMTFAGTGGSTCATPPILNVTTDGSGVINSATLATAGSCSTFPATNATTWTPGGGLSAGTGATFTLTSSVNLQFCPAGSGNPVCILSYTWPISPNTAAGYRVRVHLGPNPDQLFIWGANLQVTPGAKCWDGSAFISAPCLQNQPPPTEVPTMPFEREWNRQFARTFGGEWASPTTWTVLGNASIKSATEADVILRLDPPMFCFDTVAQTGWCPAPTVQFGGNSASLASCFTFDNGLVPTAVAVASSSSQYVKLNFTVSGATAGQSTIVNIWKSCGILVTSRLDALAGH